MLYIANEKACSCQGTTSIVPGCRGASPVSSATDERERLDGDGRALSSPVAVVQVVEAAAEALPEHVGAAQRQAPVGAEGEAGGVDGASLGWLVELELVVGGDVASPADRVGQDAVVERDLEGRAGPAGDQLVWCARRSGSGAGGSRRL